MDEGTGKMMHVSLKFRMTGAFEFHVSRTSRNKYKFEQAMFQLNGETMFVDFQAAHEFATQINAQRDLDVNPDASVKASDLNAMGLIDEILHLLIAAYREQGSAGVMGEGFDALLERFGQKRLEMCLLSFSDEFPTTSVYQGKQSLTDFFDGETDGVRNREILLEEMLMLWLANMNPAFEPYAELFDDELLREQTIYADVMDELVEFFEQQPLFDSLDGPLQDLLRAPALAAPDSLTGQLEYMMAHWGDILGEHLMKILRGLDFIKEQNMMRFGPGAGPVEVPEFSLDEPERFSEDKDWMPSLVLMAKNTYVWLDQLSKKYQRDISRLDEVPDEELDLLASWGVTGLWLIGLWERSAASKTIKQRMGQPDAVASAYSLYDYQIAADLGGEDALNDLRQRAWQRGVRMASDMVPNHMGMDSRWVVEHPDWFLSLPRPAFPSYTFTGPDLSSDDRVGIYLEDHYYDHSDAAVVFKRVDHHTGDARYIYHGNDGTSMPWNDTAQLDFLSEAVREGVIQTILHVARQFPIIRFDAAMTLAKKHIQRLWFPEPGSGGAIPSRAEHGLTKAAFEQLIPDEFWREVVDRVAKEAPDTLLLAEAFWMMEGYFVRTLGMHRVYNSAFMHMLRNEDNANYRKLIKDTLEFNPQILKRYVNFMNNPDEETAVEQFGKGDKYFGVATVMGTLPGLPMLGHGQVEGYAEKYGMEYRWAKWDEAADEDLVQRHQRQYFPLLHKRKLFAGVENFLLYDFYMDDGQVNEDVFAYSNRVEDERGLVIYLNRFKDTQGWIKTSAAYMDDEKETLVQHPLAYGLDLPEDEQAFIIFRDQISGLEYLRSCLDIHEHGLYVALNAYQIYVFVDFRIVKSSDEFPYDKLARQLAGKPVKRVEQALEKLFLNDIHDPYRELINAGMLTYLYDSRVLKIAQGLSTEPLRQSENKIRQLMDAINKHVQGRADSHMVSVRMRGRLVALLQMPILTERYVKPRSRKYKELNAWINGRLENNFSDWGVLFSWLFSSYLGNAISAHDYKEVSRGWVGDLLLCDVIEETLLSMGADEGLAERGVVLVELLIAHQDWYEVAVSKHKKPLVVLRSWLADRELREVLGMNHFEGVMWFNKEKLEDWLWWVMVVAVIEISAESGIEDNDKADKIIEVYDVIRKLQKACEVSGHQIESLIEYLGRK